jgi:hypothetical protein
MALPQRITRSEALRQVAVPVASRCPHGGAFAPTSRRLNDRVKAVASLKAKGKSPYRCICCCAHQSSAVPAKYADFDDDRQDVGSPGGRRENQVRPCRVHGRAAGEEGTALCSADAEESNPFAPAIAALLCAVSRNREWSPAHRGLHESCPDSIGHRSHRERRVGRHTFRNAHWRRRPIPVRGLMPGRHTIATRFLVSFRSEPLCRAQSLLRPGDIAGRE